MKTALLSLAALAFTAAALYLWLKAGLTAFPLIFLSLLIALTCALMILTRRR